MRPKSIILLLFALGCGLVASLGINQVMSKGSPAAAPSEEMEAIYVCARDIPINELVTQDAVKLEQWPKSKIPADAIRKLEDCVGRRTQFMLQKSDVLRNGKLLEKGALSGRPSDLITPGYRLIAVQVDAAATAGYLLKPGDRVDLLVHLRKNQSFDVPETKTITFLQNVKVFAVNTSISNNSESEGAINARTVTLELLPEQCELVNMAKQLGELTLSVRSPNDSGTFANTQGTEPSQLIKQFRDIVGMTANRSTDNPPADAFPIALPEPANKEPTRTSNDSDDTWQLIVYRGAEAVDYAFDKSGKSRKTSPEDDSDASENP